MIRCIIFDFFNVLYPYSKEAEKVVENMRLKGYALGAISSLNQNLVEEIAAHYRIDYVFSSCATCLKKTDPLIYERFLQQFKFNGEECIMIDDDQNRLRAAKMVGIKTVWLKLNEQENKEDSSDFVVSSIAALLDLNFN